MPMGISSFKIYENLTNKDISIELLLHVKKSWNSKMINKTIYLCQMWCNILHLVYNLRWTNIHTFVSVLDMYGYKVLCGWYHYDLKPMNETPLIWLFIY